MKRIFALLAALIFVFVAWAQDDEYSRDECTSLVVGRLASVDGSVITSHTCDGVSRTWIKVVPAADHHRKEMVDIFKNTRRTAFDGDTTGVRYAGQIPQARHTFAYLNTAYPCMNEKQVAMGKPRSAALTPFATEAACSLSRSFRELPSSAATTLVTRSG